MGILAARLANHFCRARNVYHPRSRNYSSLNKKDDLTLEEEAERKIGWCLKIFFAGTATYIGYQFFPYLGDNLIHQSISLLHVKDPLFKRMGASRLSRFAIDDERRMKVVEMGGAQELLHMLGTAKDDKTRKEALKALAALSKSGKSCFNTFFCDSSTSASPLNIRTSGLVTVLIFLSMLKAKCIWILNSPSAADEAAKFLDSNGALSIVKLTPDSLEDSDISTYKSNILEKLDEKNLAVSPN